MFCSDDSLDSRAALIRAIIENRLYFKIRLESIEVATPEKVEQEQNRRRKEIERVEFLRDALNYLSKLKNGENIDRCRRSRWIGQTLLEEAALLGMDWSHPQEGQGNIHTRGVNPVWDPLKVLIKLGYGMKMKTFDLGLSRSQLNFLPRPLIRRDKRVEDFR